MESSLAIDRVLVVTHFAFNLAYSVLLEIRAFHKEGAAKEICLSAGDSRQWCLITSITYYIARPPLCPAAGKDAIANAH